MTVKSTQSVRGVWAKREQIGTVGAVKQMLGVIHERGIRAAGERSLPFYWLVGYFGFALLSMGIPVLFGTGSSALALVGLLGTVATLVVLFLAWPLSGLVVYWDCLAAERYAELSFTFGKVLAIACVLLGPAGIVFFLVYRIVKFP